jgi:hypothetical protein
MTGPSSGRVGSVPVYAWITGQDTNIGDSLLRRPYLECLAEVGPVDVWVRDASPEFLSGLGATPAVISRSFARWYLRMLSSAVRRRTVVALNAGEMWISPSRVGLVLLLTFAGIIARVRGGCAVWLGASVTPTNNPVWRLSYRFAARSTAMVQWREARSNELAVPRTVGPDWAFAAGSATTQWRSDRPVLAVVLRGDRPAPSAAWMDWLVAVAASCSLELVYVVQVEADRGRAVQLAAATGGRVLEWPAGRPHRDQERAVRDLYAQTLLAVGDRLHGLVVAATEGAVPLGWVESSQGKMSRHFQAVAMPYVGEFEGRSCSEYPDLTDAVIEDLRSKLAGDIDGARRSLRETRADLAALVGR